MKVAVCALCLALGIAVAAPVRADAPSHVRIASLRVRIAHAPVDGSLRVRLAEELLRAGGPRDALVELDVLEALRPDAAGAALVRANAWLALDRPDRALAILDAHLDRVGNDADSIWLRARTRAEAGRLDEAIEDYQAAALRLDVLELHLERGRVLERAGRLAEAARAYREGLATTGSSVLREALIAVERARHRPEDALACLDAWLSTTPDAPRLLVWRAELLEELDRSDEARAERERALAIAQRMVGRRQSALALLERGRALLALGRRSEAIRDLRHASRRAPSLVDARRLLSYAGDDR